jgi:hypothetical protein
LERSCSLALRIGLITLLLNPQRPMKSGKLHSELKGAKVKTRTISETLLLAKQQNLAS